MLLFAGLLFACSPKSDTFTINGELEGLADGTKIELIPGATYKMEKPVAVTVMEGGTFTFKDTLPAPRLFYIKIADGNGWLPLMAENSKITIKGKPTFTERNGNKYYDFSTIAITGSASHDLFKEKMAFHDYLDSLYKENSLHSSAISEKMQKARLGSNNELIDSLSKTEEYQAMETRDKDFFEQVEKLTAEAVLSNKDSWWGPFMMLNNMSYFTEAEREWYNQFPVEVQESYYGKIVKENLPRESWEGNSAPHFSAKREDGTVVSYNDLIAGKRYILLDFWASWCAPCKKEIPNLRKLYSEYGSKGFEIVSISIDKDANAWKAAVKENQLTWPNFLDEDGSIADIYKVKAIPSMFLIDNTGKIILDNKRGEELAASLKELMK